MFKGAKGVCVKDICVKGVCVKGFGVEGVMAVQKVLVEVTLVVLILVALFFLLNHFWSFADDESIGVFQCSAETVQHSVSKKIFPDFLTSLNCPTRKVVVDDSSEIAVKNHLATLMYNCWSQYGKGQKELFSGDGVFCRVCHDISLQDKALKITDFGSYLANSQSPESGKTFVDALLPGGINAGEGISVFDKTKINTAVVNNWNSFSIDSAKQSRYATVFLYSKGTDLFKLINAKVNLGTGIGSVVIGIGAVIVSAPEVAIGTVIFGAGIIFTGTSLTAISVYFPSFPSDTYAGVFLRPYDEKLLEACKIIA